MLMPSIFGENLFDDFFTFERPQKQYEKEASCDLMKTDIREYAVSYTHLRAHET